MLGFSTEKIIFTILFVYAVMGLYVNTLPRHEKYPFYAWNLFSSAPNIDKGYFLKFGDTLLYGDNIGKYIKLDYPIDYYWQVQEFPKYKSVIEANFLKRPVKYELVEVEYNPLELKKFGKIISERVINEFKLY